MLIRRLQEQCDTGEYGVWTHAVWTLHCGEMVPGLQAVREQDIEGYSEETVSVSDMPKEDN